MPLEFPSVVDAVECAVIVQEVMTHRNEGDPRGPAHAAGALSSGFEIRGGRRFQIRNRETRLRDQSIPW